MLAVVPCDAANQQSQEYQCQGVPGNDRALPLHPIVDSVLNYIQAGQPRLLVAQGEQDPMADVIFDCRDSVFVKSRQCTGRCRRVDVACAACLSLCRKKAFRVCLASRSYQVDLARYAHVLFHAGDPEIRVVEQTIRERDYMALELSGNDFDDIAAMPSKLDRIRRIRKRFLHIPAWRMSPAFRTFIEVRLPKRLLLSYAQFDEFDEREHGREHEREESP